MRGDEIVIVQMRIGVMDACDFLRLSRRQRLLWIQTPCSRQKSLPPKNFMQSRDAPCKAMLRIENRRVAVRDLHGERKQFLRHRRLRFNDFMDSVQ